MDKRVYFHNLDRFVVFLAITLMLGALIGSQKFVPPHRYQHGNQVPLNATQRLEQNIVKLSGIRKADVKQLGSTAAVHLWFDAAVQMDEAILLGETIKDMTMRWNTNLTNCSIKYHLVDTSYSFAPY